MVHKTRKFLLAPLTLIVLLGSSFAMLAILENEMEKPGIGTHRPRYAIYQAIPHHVVRCMGRAFWDKSGPKYVLSEEGEAIYTGPFHHPAVSRLIKFMIRSKVALRWLSLSPQITVADIELYVAIVKKATVLFKKRYGGEFYVLLWPSANNWEYSEICRRLSAQQIKIIKIEEILPDYTDGKKYRIQISIDNHPNSLAYERIADGLPKYLKLD